MRLYALQRRGSRPALRRSNCRLVVEQLESRLVPSGIFPPGTAPTITSISPTSAVEGSAMFTLTVNGTNFNPSTMVLLNGMILPTTFVSSTQVTALVGPGFTSEETASNHGGPGTLSIFQFGGGGAGTSGSVPFTVSEAPLTATAAGSLTSVMPGQPLSGVTLATFSDAGGPESLSDYSATINWGDTTTSTGTITGPDLSGLFTVSGSHTYAVGGNFNISVTVTHETAPPVTVVDTINLPGGPVVGTGGFTLTAMELVPVTGTVATFTGGNNNCTATINWGDLTTSTGTITGPDASGKFTVTGTHTYLEDGEVESDLIDPFPVTVSINCPGMPTVTVTSTVNSGEEPGGPAATPPGSGAQLLTSTPGAPLSGVPQTLEQGPLGGGPAGSNLGSVPVQQPSSLASGQPLSGDLSEAALAALPSNPDLFNPNAWAADELALALGTGTV